MNTRANDTDTLHTFKRNDGQYVSYDSVTMRTTIHSEATLPDAKVLPLTPLNVESLRRSAFTHTAGRVRSFRIVLTEACNYSCTYCFEQRGMNRARSMSPEILESTISRIIEDNPAGHVAIHWFGGEPLIRWSLIARGIRLFSEAVDSGRLRSVTHGLTTNGSLINDKMATQLADARVETFVSIDGPKPTNDLLRIDRQGLGTFDRSMTGYHNLVSVGADAGLLFTAQPDTLTAFADSVIQVLEEHEVSKAGVNSPQPTSQGWGLDGTILANQMYQIIEYCHAHGIRLVSPGLRILRALAYKEPHVADCRTPSGDMSVSIDMAGNVSGCIVSWAEEAPWPVEPLTGQRLRYLELVKGAPTLRSSCRGCLAEMVCGGPCALELRLQGGLHPDRCAFYREFLRLALTQSPVSKDPG